MEKLLNWFKNRGPTVAAIVLLAVIPLYPKFPLKSIGGTYVSIRLVDLLVAGGVFLGAISQLLEGGQIFKSKIFKLFIIYWLAGFVANLVGWYVLGTISPKIAFLHWARRVEYMSLFFIAFQAIKTKKDLKDCQLVIGLALLGVFIYGWGQKYWQFPVISTMNEEFSKGVLLYLDKWTRINSTFAGHYDLAAWLVMILSLFPAGLSRLKSWWKKILGFILGFFGLFLLVLTASRVSFFAYLIGISGSLLFLRKYKWIPPVLLFSLFLGFTSKELNARLRSTLPSMPELNKKIAYVSDFWETETKKVSDSINKNVSDRLKRLRRKKVTPTPIPTALEPTEVPLEEGIVSVPTKKEEVKKKVKEIRTWPTREEAEAAAARSSNIRFQVEWPRAIKAFLKNPLTGTGFSSLGLATDNDYLRLMGETGITGLGSFMLIIIHLLRTFWQAVRKKTFNWQFAAGLIGLLLGILANGLFIDIFEASKVAFYFWLLMGIGYKISNSQFSNLQK